MFFIFSCCSVWISLVQLFHSSDLSQVSDLMDGWMEVLGMLPARPDPNLLALGIPCWDSSGSSSQTDPGNRCCGSWAPSWIRGRRKEWEFADRRPQDEFFPKKSTSQARPRGFGCPGLSPFPDIPRNSPQPLQGFWGSGHRGSFPKCSALPIPQEQSLEPPLPRPGPSRAPAPSL